MAVKFSQECLRQKGPPCDLVKKCERPGGCKYAPESLRISSRRQKGEVGGPNKTRIVDGGSMNH